MYKNKKKTSQGKRCIDSPVNWFGKGKKKKEKKRVMAGDRIRKETAWLPTNKIEEHLYNQRRRTCWGKGVPATQTRDIRKQKYVRSFVKRWRCLRISSIRVVLQEFFPNLVVVGRRLDRIKTVKIREHSFLFCFLKCRDSCLVCNYTMYMITTKQQLDLLWFSHDDMTVTTGKPVENFSSDDFSGKCPVFFSF